MMTNIPILVRKCVVDWRMCRQMRNITTATNLEFVCYDATSRAAYRKKLREELNAVRKKEAERKEENGMQEEETGRKEKRQK
jgi:transcriptional regulator of met regulon